MPTIQIADKPTLDEVYKLSSNLGDIKGTTILLEKGLPLVLRRGSSQVLVYQGKIHLFSQVSDYQTKHYIYDGDIRKSSDGDHSSYWTRLDDLPCSIWCSSMVVYQGNIHLLRSGSYQKGHYVYDGTSWTQLGDIPCSPVRNQGSAVVYRDKIHLFTNGEYYTYDGTSWTHVEPGASLESIDLDTAVDVSYFGEAVVFQDKLHLWSIHHYTYDGTSWTQLDDLPTDIGYHCASVVDEDHIHYFAGTDDLNNNVFKHYTYDGTTWSEISTLPSRLYAQGAVVYKGGISVFGQSQYYTLLISKTSISSSRFGISYSYDYSWIPADDEDILCHTYYLLKDTIIYCDDNKVKAYGDVSPTDDGDGYKVNSDGYVYLSLDPYYGNLAPYTIK